MDFLKGQELLVRKPSSKESQIDYITYDPQRHVMSVGTNHQKLIYMGVPESVFFHLSLIGYPDDVFFNQVFNKYPVVIERERLPESVKNRRRRYKKRLVKEEIAPPQPNWDDWD